MQAPITAPATRNPFTAGDVETALYATEIDQLAERWQMDVETAIRWQQDQDTVTKQPTVISGSQRMPAVQLSIFEVMQMEQEPEAPILPGLARYESGKALLQRARLLEAKQRKPLAQKGPVICRNRTFYTLEPYE